MRKYTLTLLLPLLVLTGCGSGAALWSDTSERMFSDGIYSARKSRAEMELERQQAEAASAMAAFNTKLKMENSEL